MSTQFTKITHTIALGLSIAATVPTIAVAADSSPLKPAVTLQAASSNQSVTVGGKQIRFSVAWEALPLEDAQGTPQATVSAVSYVRRDLGDASRRPVIVAFNGGPGSAAAMLNFGLLGPHLRAGSAWGTDGKGVETNESTLLDVADLLLIDPVGTGLSRALVAGGGTPYWSVDGDAKSVEAMLRAWLRAHDRTQSPILIVGESYGTFRASYMAPNLTDLDVVGMVLISPGIDETSMDGGDESVIFDFPSMAVAAYTHGKSKASSPEDAYYRARRFAQKELASALQLGWDLPDAQRHAVAGKMASMIGLPASFIEKSNLRVKSQDFLEQLLPGKVIGRVDTRVTAEAPKQELVSDRRKEADDPALAMGASNVKKSPWVTEYLRDVVGVKTSDDYVSLTLDVNFGWDWRSSSKTYEDNTHLNALPRLAEFLTKKPKAKVLVASGFYDLAAPMLATQYSIGHGDIAKGRVEFINYESGHAVYDGAANRAAVDKDIRGFLAKVVSTGR